MAVADSGPAMDNAGKRDDLGSAINAAIDAVSEPTPSAASKPSKVEDAVKIEADTEAPDLDKAGDESGSEKAPPQKSKKQDDQKDVTPAPDAGRTPEAPKHWATEDKAAFAALPEDAKAVLLKLSKNLEGGFTRKSQELSDKSRYADQVRGLFSDHDRAQMAQAQTDEMGVINHLLKVQRFATESPKDYLKWAMQNLGVKPEDLGLPQATQSAQPPGQPTEDDLEALLRDPAISKLEAKLASLEGMISQREQVEQQAIRQKQAEAVQTLKSSISGFREMQDEHGQLAHPHFDTVQRHMGALMEADSDIANMPDGPDKLKAAYEAAVWARPDLRQSMLDAQNKVRAMDDQKREAAERARRATSVKPAAGVSNPKSRAPNLDSALSSAMGKYGF